MRRDRGERAACRLRGWRDALTASESVGGTPLPCGTSAGGLDPEELREIHRLLQTRDGDGATGKLVVVADRKAFPSSTTLRTGPSGAGKPSLAVAVRRLLPLTATPTRWKAILGVVEVDRPIAVRAAIAPDPWLLTDVMSCAHAALLSGTFLPYCHQRDRGFSVRVG